MSSTFEGADASRVTCASRSTKRTTTARVSPTPIRSRRPRASDGRRLSRRRAHDVRSARSRVDRDVAVAGSRPPDKPISPLSRTSAAAFAGSASVARPSLWAVERERRLELKVAVKRSRDRVVDGGPVDGRLEGLGLASREHEHALESDEVGLGGPDDGTAERETPVRVDTTAELGGATQPEILNGEATAGLEHADLLADDRMKR